MDKIQTLREKDNPSNNVYPNVLPQNIPANAITTAKIVDEAVTSNKIAPISITSAKIVPEAVTGDKIASGAVSSSRLASNSVTTAKIVDEAITEAKLSVKNSTLPLYMIDKGISPANNTPAELASAFERIIKSRDALVLSVYLETNALVVAPVFLSKSASTPKWVLGYDFSTIYQATSVQEVTDFLIGIAQLIHIVYID